MWGARRVGRRGGGGAQWGVSGAGAVGVSVVGRCVRGGKAGRAGC